jgi:hypothetical protein
MAVIDICDGPPYCPHHLHQTVNLLASERFFHVWELIKVTRNNV